MRDIWKVSPPKTNPPLTIELVPSTVWWSNVRSNIPAKDWEKCKTFVKERSGGACEICGGKGRRWAVECHEIWDYDDINKKQTLVDLIALCPPCHQAKHFGRSMQVKSQAQMAFLIEHMMKVNDWPDPFMVEDAAMTALNQFEDRSKFEWSLDVSFLNMLGIDLPDTLDREKGPRRG